MDMKNSTFSNRLECYRKLNSAKKNFVNIDLYKLMIKDDALIAGYEKIKSNKKITTADLDTISLNGWNFTILKKLRDALRNESWQPSLVRTTYVPKPGKLNNKTLGVQGLEEKVVQATMSLILESIYEPVFLDTCFGFSPGKKVHNALTAIDQKYDSMTFAIEGDIQGMYDHVNHRTLVTLMKKRIQDDRFMRLVWKMLRAGYFTAKKQLEKPHIGTLQGSVISTILANIYLHELDLFMDTISDILINNSTIHTPMYKVKNNEMWLIKSFLTKDILDAEEICDYKNQIVYTRYANNFIVGIAGSLKFAERIKEQIIYFLSTLHLSSDKIKITNIRKEPAFFLGHNILIKTVVKYTYVKPKGKSCSLKRVTDKLVSIEAPIHKIVQKLSTKGFCDIKGYPTTKKLWITQQDNQIVQNFNYTIREIFGYYSGVHKRRNLQRIWYILKFSCALTLASRHRCSLRKVFKKYGNQFKVIFGKSGEKVVTLYQPSLKKKYRKW